MSTNGIRVEYAGEITFEEWHWAVPGRAGSDEVISKAVAAVLSAEFKGHPPRMSLPATYAGSGGDGLDGPPVSDPLTIEVEIDAVGEEYDGPRWRFRLSDVIHDALSMHETAYSKKIDDEGLSFAHSLRDRLRALATEIDDRVAKYQLT